MSYAKHLTSSDLFPRGIPLSDHKPGYNAKKKNLKTQHEHEAQSTITMKSHDR